VLGTLTSGQVESSTHIDNAPDIAILGRIQQDGVASFAMTNQGKDPPVAETPVIHDGSYVVCLTPIASIPEFAVALAVAGEIESVGANPGSCKCLRD